MAALPAIALTPAPEPLLAKARAMRDWLAGMEQETNARRQVPAKTIQAFKDAGFFRLVQPLRYGGCDANGGMSGEIVDALTMGCSSSAWVYGVLALHHLFLAAWPEAVQEEVWGDDPDVLISSSLAPRPVTRVDGGYRLTGGWSFSSGCDHCGWAMLGGLPEGIPPVMMLVPMAEMTIEDDWHTLGLRGTGSKTLRLDEVFVPDRRAVPLARMMGGSPKPMPPGGSFWDHAPPALFGVYNFSCVLLGLARREVEMITEMLRTRVSRGVALRDVAGHRMRLAHARSIVDMVTFQMHEGCRRHVANIRAGVAYGARDLTALGRDNAVMVHQLRDVVISLADINAGWIYNRDPSQQIVRDMLTGCMHRSASFEAMVLPDAAFALDGEG